jgi:hypothetical protein
VKTFGYLLKVQAPKEKDGYLLASGVLGNTTCDKQLIIIAFQGGA